MKKQADRIGSRVNLTLPAEVVAVLDRLGKLTDTPRATIIREWLEAAAPQMSEMAEALALAKSQQAEALSKLARVTRDVSSQAHQLELDVRSLRRRAVRRKSPK